MGRPQKLGRARRPATSINNIAFGRKSEVILAKSPISEFHVAARDVILEPTESLWLTF